MITSDSIQLNTKIKRAILEQKIDELKTSAYDLRLNAEVALAQAEVYDDRDAQSLTEEAAKDQKKAASAESGIRRLIVLRGELPTEGKPEQKPDSTTEDAAPPAEDPEE